MSKTTGTNAANDATEQNVHEANEQIVLEEDGSTPNNASISNQTHSVTPSITEDNNSAAASNSNNSNELIETCSKYSYLDGKFFTVVEKNSTLNGKIEAACVCCNDTVKGMISSSTNFVRHLKRKHPDYFKEYEQYKVIKKSKTDKADVHRRVTCSFSQDTFEQNVTNCIIENQLAFQLVENKAFRKIFDDFKIKCGTTGMVHMTRYKVEKNLNQLFSQQIEQIKLQLENVSYVCTTADIWTGGKRRFLGVTAHWIDESTLKRKSAALACRCFVGTHSYDRIAEILNAINEQYNLDPNKVVATVTDNGSNFSKAFKVFGVTEFNIEKESSELMSQSSGESSNQELVMDTNNEESGIESDDITIEDDENYEDIVIDYQLPHHLRCASHTLSLIATVDAIKAINGNATVKVAHDNAMDYCNVLWKNMNSPKKREELERILKCNIKRPVPTRWNSMYDALQQIHSLQDKLLKTETKLITNALFRQKDFDYIAEYLHWCSPLAKAIDILQGEEYCHYGYLLPTILIIRKKWRSILADNSYKYNKLIISKLIDNLETRFKMFFNIAHDGKFAAIASVTHPKFKLNWITALEEGPREMVKNLVLSLLRRPETAEKTSSSDNEDNFFDFDRDDSVVPNNSLCGNEENEMMRYLGQKSTSMNLLNDFPVVKKLFLKYNTPLPSSAPVERLFSVVTMQNLPKFNRIKDEQFEKRVLYKTNLKKLYS